MSSSVVAITRLVALVAPDELRALGDAELLTLYQVGRDEGAFALLVERHGSMVQGVCQRVLGSVDAEDASQATFLILAQRATALQGHPTLAGWLHQTARLVACALKRKIARRQRHEAGVACHGEPTRCDPDPTWREAGAILDEELERLPERYRQPLILCYLQGHTREEGAALLGWKPDVFRGRLDRGRERLRAGLVRRGLTLTAACAVMTAPVGSLNAAATLPFRVQLGREAATALAVGLSQEVTRAMWCNKLVWSMAAGFCLVLVSFGLAQIPGGQATPDQARVGSHAPQTGLPETPLEPGNGVPGQKVLVLNAEEKLGGVRQSVFSANGTWLALYHANERISVWDTRDGKLVRALTSRDLESRHLFALSGDGGLLFAWNASQLACSAWNIATGTRRTVFDVEKRESDIRDNNGAVTFDGKQIATVHDGGGCSTLIQVREVATGKLLWSLNNDDGQSIVHSVAFSPNGKCLAAGTQAGRIKLFDGQTGQKMIFSLGAAGRPILLSWSGNGKRLAAFSRTGLKSEVAVWNVETARVFGRVPLATRNVIGLALSPDGQQVAILEEEAKQGTWFSVWNMRSETRVCTHRMRGAQALVWTNNGKSVLVVREAGNRELLAVTVPPIGM